MSVLLTLSLLQFHFVTTMELVFIGFEAILVPYSAKYKCRGVYSDHKRDLSLSQVLFDAVIKYKLYAHNRLE